MKLDFWLLYIDSISSQIDKLLKNGAFLIVEHFSHEKWSYYILIL